MLFSISQVVLMIAISTLLWIVAGINWSKLSNFSHKRITYIDFSFILIYFIEQFFLQLLIYSTDYPTQLIFGVFSIIILTTASIQNRWNASRIQKINDVSIEQREVMYQINEEVGIILEENKKLNKILRKSKKYINGLYDELNSLYILFEKLKK
ncbi:MAG: hypothetical protein IH845_01250 [Nanoarchaeota archaeon]|nr:hypothetical protein [Nanoarchaeota archaeon]